jgi:hypothetical protein
MNAFAGLVPTLAEELKRQPLRHTRVFAVCTGCEEVQHYGMIDWYRRHRAEVRDPKDEPGSDGPHLVLHPGLDRQDRWLIPQRQGKTTEPQRF